LPPAKAKCATGEVWGNTVAELTVIKTETSERPDGRKFSRARMLRVGRELGVDEPTPVKDSATIWRHAAQFSTIGMFFLAFLVALYLARPVLLPTVTAFVVGLMLGPLANYGRRLGLPPIFTAIVLWFAVVAVFYGAIAILAAPAIEWIGKIPQIGATVKEKLHVLDAPLAALKDLRNAILPEGEKAGVGFDLASIVQPALIVVTPAIGQIFIFFGTLFFFLLGRARLRNVMVFFFADRESRLRMLKIFNDLEYNLTTYLSVVAVINLGVGVAAFIIAWGVGLPSPLAWGVLGFILNFIPYLGALMMEVVLLTVGLVTFDTLTHALVAPALYLVFTTLEGHFITPGVMGRRLTLNPLTVFLALIFWTWLWGPVGAFIAVPLLIVALVVTQHLFPKAEPILPG
jgi:predicted PurR-regulated permease PerM